MGLHTELVQVVLLDALRSHTMAVYTQNVLHPLVSTHWQCLDPRARCDGKADDWLLGADAESRHPIWDSWPPEA